MELMIKGPGNFDVNFLSFSKKIHGVRLQFPAGEIAEAKTYTITSSGFVQINGASDITRIEILGDWKVTDDVTITIEYIIPKLEAVDRFDVWVSDDGDTWEKVASFLLDSLVSRLLRYLQENSVTRREFN